jgi:hypothetical protein
MLSDRLRGAKAKGGKQPKVNNITADIQRRLGAGSNPKETAIVQDMVEANRRR